MQFGYMEGDVQTLTQAQGLMGLYLIKSPTHKPLDHCTY